MSRVARCTGKGRVSARPGPWEKRPVSAGRGRAGAIAGVIGTLACVGLLILVAVIPVVAEAPEDSDSGLTALFVRYYSAVQKGRWEEAFKLLHDRLKTATQVNTPEDLARWTFRTQQELINAFQSFDHIEVAKADVDLTSIQGRILGVGNGNVSGEVTYDLIVFPKGPGRPLMYRVMMMVGLSEGLIIRITQQSMTRIDPGGLGGAV